MKQINYAYLSGAMEGALTGLKYDLILKKFVRPEIAEELSNYIDELVKQATLRAEEYSNKVYGNNNEL